MRIGIDARLAYYRREGGIAQYTIRLIQALAQLDSGDRFVVLLHRRDRLDSILPPAPNVRARRLWTPSHHRFEQWTLPIETNLANIEVLHSPDFIPPFRRNCASVITVHDLAFKLYPQLLTAESAAYYGQIERAVRSAEQIIAVSEATRQDMLRLLEVEAGKITVIHEAADPIYRPLDDSAFIAEVLGKYQLSRPFVLFVGTVEPRKNLSMLLRAFRLVLDRHGDKVTLAIAGSRGWLADDVFALAGQLRLGDHVKFLGAVPSRELSALYNAAHVFVMPSLYEGFGLPVVEAMSCGAPVLVSNVSSLPEVAGEAGVCLDPGDERAWADALLCALADEAWRLARREASLKQAARFSWNRAAHETLLVYRKAVSGIS